jgi:putative Ca2+/H+ antiporter (TMEM165/GDT1 family)
MLDQATLISAFLTIVSAIFIAELTDKDALLLLTLATKTKAWVVFAAGSFAFTITSAIIVSVGYLLVSIVPVSLITIAGGLIMIGYAAWGFFKAQKGEEKETGEAERRITAGASRNVWAVFLTIVSFLVLLDLAGDATEVLTILFVARYENTLLVFTGAVCALVAASAVETMIGNRLSRILTHERIRIVSTLVFLVIGTTAILTALFHL